MAQHVVCSPSSQTLQIIPTVSSMPFRQFHGDALGSDKEDQFSVMVIHNFVARLKSIGDEFVQPLLNIVHGKADMIESKLSEISNVRVRDRIGVMLFD